MGDRLKNKKPENIINNEAITHNIFRTKSRVKLIGI
jgi:hypothetical protein